MSLPSGYTRLEYIESTGTQYIDTGFKPTFATRVKMECTPLAQTAASAGIFGARSTSQPTSPYAFCAWTMSTGATVRSDYFGTNSVGSTSITNKRVNIDKNRNAYTDGYNTLTNTAKTSGTSPYALYLFCCNDIGDAKYYKAMRLYSCQIYDDDVLIRDFIPCKNASGVIGLWDEIGQTFYKNNGKGTFTAGAEVRGAHKFLIDGTVYSIHAGNCLVGGTGYAISKGRTLIDGTGMDIPLTSKRALSDIGVGEKVYLNVSGIQKAFFVAQKGLPSSLYDDSCDGAWLLMEDNFGSYAWGSSKTSNAYEDSLMHKTVMNQTFYNALDSDVQSLVKQVKIPYYAGGGKFGILRSGANGLSTKAFVISTGETGLYDKPYPNDGLQLEIYKSGTFQLSCITRSPYVGSDEVWIVWDPANKDDGMGVTLPTTKSTFVHPMIILPLDALVDADNNIIAA